MDNSVPKKEFTRELALFQTKYGGIVEWRADWEDEDYVRVSEPVTVIFKPLDHDIILRSRVDALSREIAKVRAEAQAKVSDLEDQRQRLLAITHEEA